MSVKVGPIIVVGEETEKDCQIIFDGEDLGRITWQEILRRADDSEIDVQTRRAFASVAGVHLRFPPPGSSN